MSEQIITKRCFKCKQIKPLSEFYKNTRCKDGYANCCKSCRRKQMNQYAKSEKGKAVYKKYNTTEKGRTRYKRYEQTEKRRSYYKAKDAVNNAIKRGKLPRANTLQCHYCPKQAEQYHHHKGYEPEHYLDVIPVCIDCHKKLRLK